jgi:hypothetical protein
MHKYRQQRLCIAMKFPFTQLQTKVMFALKKYFLGTHRVEIQIVVDLFIIGDKWLIIAGFT